MKVPLFSIRIWYGSLIEPVFNAPVSVPSIDVSRQAGMKDERLELSVILSVACPLIVHPENTEVERIGSSLIECNGHRSIIIAVETFS